jgi:hypothetical protein
MSFKRTWIGAAFVSIIMVAAASSQASANLIVDGDFSSPSQSGGWSIYTPGVDGWVNDNSDGIEIGTSTIYGLPCANGACQNLEVNANTFDTDGQTVSGLTVDQTYDLSYLYGGRTSGGPDTLDVYFGGMLLSVDTDSIGLWTLYSFNIVATSTTEALIFSSVVTGGDPSYGNEITNVSLTATPLPSTWIMLIAGFASLGFFAYRGSKNGSRALTAA